MSDVGVTTLVEASRRAPSRRISPTSSLRRRHPGPESRAFWGLTLFGLVSLGLIVVFPDQVPFTTLMLPLLVAGLFLGPRTLPWYVLFNMTALSVALTQQTEVTTRVATAAVLQFVMGVVVLVVALRRSRLGVTGIAGESMLVDLRDRILVQGRIPALPACWDVQSALRSAGGTLFAGDFLVATTTSDNRLEVVVVDVSGKGENAGTRALLLSGAFGGLLGALPADRFLPAANDYLLRQNWEEGFATAIHLSLNLCSGGYEIRTAGHPPAAHRISGSGRWRVLESEGPVLGLMTEAEFTVATGVLNGGDAVLLYTDGMVEDPHRDIELGIDAMLGEAESLLRGTFRDAAERLVGALGSSGDDRALLVVHRT